MPKINFLMAKIGYYILSSFLWTMAWLPLSVLYLLSNGLYYTIYYIVGYRKKIVIENLSKAFPEKSSEEIEVLTKKFFRHFCDTIVEILKLMHTSEKQMDKRISFKNIEILQKYHDEGKPVTALMSHYANWEYIPFISCKLNAASASIYHRLRNKDFDELMLGMRGQFGLRLFPMATTFRELIKLKKECGDYVLGVIADQIPHNENTRSWFKFLNQETAAFMGAEKIATRFNHAVVFMKMSKNRRGHFVIEVVPVAENAADLKPYELTLTYHKLLEDQIKEKPELWLWSHRRWKKTRRADEKLILHPEEV